MSKKLTTEQFILDSRKVHGDKYDYSKVEYVKNSEKVCIICPEHGYFWQIANDNKRGKGCPYCGGVGRLTKDVFVERANKVHNNRYCYDKTEIINAATKTIIICPVHGEFKQSPHDHLFGAGCPECGKKAVWDARGRITTDDFIRECKKIHGNLYDYSLTNYVNSRTKVKVICKEHGVFEIFPRSHKNGDGCPYCHKSNMERRLADMLKNEKINFVNGARFSWLGKQHLDFYLPDYNIGIECQGAQHFIPTDFAGKGKEVAIVNLEEIKSRDIRKKKLCDENNVRIIYCGDERSIKYDKSLVFIDNVINLINE